METFDPAKRRFSASQLGTWNRCQLQWFFRYVEGIKSPPAVAMIVGTGCHAGIEANLTAKMAGQSMAFEEVGELSRDAVRREWGKEAPSDGADPNALADATDQAAGLAIVHARDAAPEIVPIALEQKLEVDFPDYDFGILGYIDVLEDGRIRDTKSAGKKPSAGAADSGDHANQLTLYSLATGIPDVVLDYLVKNKTPTYERRQGTPRHAGDYVQLLDRFQRMYDGIESGVFAPAEPGHWVCSPKFCGYWDRCEFGARGRNKDQLIPAVRLLNRPEVLGGSPAVDDLDGIF